MRVSAMIAMAIPFCAFALAEARIPALDEDSLYLARIENQKGSEPKVYVWAASDLGPMFASVRSDIGGWWMYSLSVSASTRNGWLMTLRIPEVGLPPPTLLSRHDSATQEDSLFGLSVLAGKRERWKHAHILLAAGINHAQGVRIQSHDTCGSLFSGCRQIVDRKESFNGFAPILQFGALTGWRYFGLGAGVDVLGTRHQSWGWHIQIVGGRVF